MITNYNDVFDQNKSLANEALQATKNHENFRAELNDLQQSMTLRENAANIFDSPRHHAELVQNLISSEAALKNSERTNINLIMNLKELEKKFEITEKRMKETNLKLLTARGQLKTKGEEVIFLNEKFYANKNTEELPKIIDDLSAQLLEKDKMLATVWEELMIKDKLLSAAVETTQKLRLDQAMFLEEAQNMQRRLVSTSDSEITQIRMENHRLAQLIFYHEKLKIMFEEKIRSLEFGLSDDQFKNNPQSKIFGFHKFGDGATGQHVDEGWKLQSKD